MAKMAKTVSRLMEQAKMAATPHIEYFKACGKVELTPPSFRDIPAAVNQCKGLIDAAKKGAFKNVTVRDAWLNALVATEVISWFFIGECIGKLHYVGYNV